MQREYYSCDATYRNWLKYELENADVSPSELSLEEKERAAAAAREAIWSTLSLVESESIYLSFFYFLVFCLPAFFVFGGFIFEL